MGEGEAAQAQEWAAGDADAALARGLRGRAAGAAERLEAQRQVARLRGALSEVEMEALVLSCVEELSAREIGRVMGRSVRAVHSILHRARRKARERLAEDDG